MRGGLIGYGIRAKPEIVEQPELFGGIAFVADRDGFAASPRLFDLAQRLLARLGDAVEIAQLAPALQTRAVDVDDQADSAVHRDRQRLRAAHSADTGRQRYATGKRAAEMQARQLGKGLVRPLHDALRADIDPRAGRHLAVHRQPLRFQLAKDAPVGPLRHEVRVGDQHARGASVRFEDRDGLTALNDQRLVGSQPPQRPYDRIEGFPRTRGAAVSAVHDQIVRAFGNLGIEVVHQHAQRGFLRPPKTAKLGSARRSNGARSGDYAHNAPEFSGIGTRPLERSRECMARMCRRRNFSVLILTSILGFAFSTGTGLAGTTGSLTGTVAHSATGAPVAGAKVAAVSPSQTTTVTTDASGRFSILSLAPDTYTISVSKDGFETSTTTGISIFADQVQTLRIPLAPSMRTIAHVTSRSSDGRRKIGHHDRCLFGQLDGNGGRGRHRRRRQLEQRILGDRRGPRRVRAAQPARLGPDRLYSRRQLRSGRLRVRRRSGQSLVR